MAFDFMTRAVRHAEELVDTFKRNHMRKPAEVLVGYPRPKLMTDLERFSGAKWLARFRIAWSIATDMEEYESDMERCAQFYDADFRVTGQLSHVEGHPEVFRLRVDGLHDGQEHFLYLWSAFEYYLEYSECYKEPVAVYLVNDEGNPCMPAGVSLCLHMVERRPGVAHTGLYDLRIARGFMSDASFPGSVRGEHHAEL